jgi:hypothetical protein
MTGTNERLGDGERQIHFHEDSETRVASQSATCMEIFGRNSPGLG